MKYTLLDMTQNILSRLSSDEVNSIGDTTESLQVANIIKNKYFDIIDRVKLTDHEQLIQLDASTDPLQPVLMYVPSEVKELSWIKYFDSRTDVNQYCYVTILPVQQFIDMTNGLDPDQTNVGEFTFTDGSNGFPGEYTFRYKTDEQPQFCTVLSNYYVIFSSYNTEFDTTLETSKTMGWGVVIPTFELVDDFIPDLADEQFQLLVNEATALAFFELKQQPHQLAMQESKRGWSLVQRNKAVINRPTYFDQLPNFGRGTRAGPAQVSYFKSRGFDR